MTARSRNTLKSYFNTGDKPTEGEFADKIDSFYHRDDLGWADYSDSQYTSGSPLSLSAGVPALFNNDGVNGVRTYEPPGVALYDTTARKISGIEGESRLITIDFKIKPTSGAAVSAEVWLDIGGAVGELYRRLFTFPKGSGVERNVVMTSAVYTLDTWQANSAEVWIECDGPAEVYDIRYVIVRTSKVF
jgi:hypothetical protein